MESAIFYLYYTTISLILGVMKAAKERSRGLKPIGICHKSCINPNEYDEMAIEEVDLAH